MINVRYELASDLPLDRDLDIREERGLVVFRVGDYLTPEQIMEVLNEGVRKLLEGGHWFQEWHGDIVTNVSSVKLERAS